jgi:hypothetical protein
MATRKNGAEGPKRSLPRKPAVTRSNLIQGPNRGRGALPPSPGQIKQRERAGAEGPKRSMSSGRQWYYKQDKRNKSTDYPRGAETYRTFASPPKAKGWKPVTNRAAQQALSRESAARPQQARTRAAQKARVERINASRRQAAQTKRR